MAIQIRRGTEAQWENGKSNILDGEPAITTDTNRLFVGTGNSSYAEFFGTTTTSIKSNNLFGWQGLTLTQNGSNTFTLVSGYLYIGIVTRLNNSSDTYTGLYVIRPHSNLSSIATIKASSSTTLSISGLTLTASTTTPNTSLILFPVRAV